MNEYETKFILNNSSAHIFIAWLRCRCLPDSEFPGGIVSSIYYDKQDWRFLREKLNSDFHKTKVRIRWYVDMDTGKPSKESFLEVKYKTGNRRKKIRIKTGKRGEWFSGKNLDNRKLLDIPHLLWSRGVMIHGPFYPVFKVDYKRLRFIEPITGTRLCIDYDICAPAVNWQMLPRANSFQLQTAVFEMKGALAQLPDILHQLTALGCRKESFSKYSACYKKIMRVTF